MVSVPWQGLQEHPKHQISVLGVVLIYLGLLMEQNVPLHSPILNCPLSLNGLLIPTRHQPLT